jgi:hypothetical protein
MYEPLKKQKKHHQKFDFEILFENLKYVQIIFY